MQAVIEIRFGFKPENVHLLIDDQATRQAILDGIQRYLIQEAEPGDVVFLYYAGHGSQVRNSFSYERDKMDQTIVPVDANRGVHDIRDKALARLFNQMLDKHLTVTAIFDSCHSGAIARGFIVPARGRYLPAIDDRDAKDAFRGPFPENRGALIVSAAQANEQALETETEPVHGLFTGALLRVLSIVPVNTPVSEIFKIVEAQVATDDPYESLGYGIEDAQIPNWAGKDRGANSLFSIRSEQAAREFTVPALSPDIQRGVVSLEGGLSIGLAPGSELTRVGGQTNAPEIRLEVVDSSAAQSVARVVHGNVTDVHVGDLFEVVKWAETAGSVLTVWLPLDPPSSEAIRREAVEQRRAAEVDGLTWVYDPTNPDVCAPHEIYWSENRWQLYRPSVSCTTEKFTASSRPQHREQFFLSLPASPELDKMLSLGEGLQVTHSLGKANYLLVGRLNAGRLEYAWVHPNSVSEGMPKLPLPPRSDWIPLNDESSESLKATSAQLVLRAQRLARVYRWLTLKSPPDSGDFPYHLELKRDCGPKCAEYKTDGDTVREGERYGLTLRAKPADVAPSFSRVQKWRWVYVFVVDSWGRSQLLAPTTAAGNEEKTNLEPPSSEVVATEQGFSWPTEIPILNPGTNTGFTISAPFGVDTYFLLTTREPIGDFTGFEFCGARSRGAPQGTPSSALEQLLEGMNSNTRGAEIPVKVPQEWSIQKLFVRSIGNTREEQNLSGCDFVE